MTSRELGPEEDVRPLKKGQVILCLDDERGSIEFLLSGAPRTITHFCGQRVGMICVSYSNDVPTHICPYDIDYLDFEGVMFYTKSATSRFNVGCRKLWHAIHRDVEALYAGISRRSVPKMW